MQKDIPRRKLDVMERFPDIREAFSGSKFTHPLTAVLTLHMSHVKRKPAFCICENKDAEQLRSNHEADQRLCFCYIDKTIPLLSK